MAVKALATITLHAVVDVAAIYRYYKLQSSTADAPVKPDAKPEDPQREAPSGWQVGEPTYTAGDTNSLYHVDLNLFSDGTFQYSNVSLSSAYEAAKEAYNKATSAKDAADSVQEKVDNMEIGGRNLLLDSQNKTFKAISTSVSSVRIDNTYQKNENNTLKLYVTNPESSGTKYSAYYPRLRDARPITLQAETGDVYKGKNLTYSIWMYNPEETEYRNFEFGIVGVKADGSSMWDLRNSDFPSSSFRLKNGWNYVYAVFNIPEDVEKIYPRVTIYTAGSTPLTLYVSSPKVEFGTKPTDWTPAPEDAMDDVGSEYYLSTSATSLSGGSWSTTAPEWVDGKYMWSRTVKVDGAGNKTYSPSETGVCIAGAKGATGEKGDKGDTGATGPQGEKGDTGATGPQGEPGKDGADGKDGTDGRSVKSVVRYYKLATTKPTTPSTSWSTTEPVFDEMEDTTSTLYFADLTTFSDNGTSWSAVSVSSSYEAAKKAYEEALAAQQRLVLWCSENDQTLIDGAKIYTKSIGAAQIAAGAVIAEKIAAGAVTTEKLAAKAVTANKINVTELFAQDITATGTIRGVNLVGAKGSFSESLSVYSSTEDSTYLMGLKAGAESFKVGWWNKGLEDDPTTSFLEIAKSGGLQLINNVSDIYLNARGNVNLNASNGATIISGSGCKIEATMRYGLEFENNKRIGFLTSAGASSRGIGLSSSDNLLFGSGDEGTTNGMYFYVGAKDSFAVYGGSSKDVRFRSFEASDGKMYIQAPDINNRTTSSGSNVRVNSNGTLYKYVSSSSSIRYKKDITTKLNDELDPERLYDLKIWQYKYREGHLDKNDQRYGQDIIGFIAEDVKQKYPIAANYDEDGRIEGWSTEIILPAMLKLIQNQKKEIDELKERLN